MELFNTTNVLQRQYNVSVQRTNDTVPFVDHNLMSIAGNYALLIVCLTALLTDSISFYAVYNGRKMPPYSRHLSMCYISGDLLCSFFFALHQVLMFGFGLQNELVRMSRIIVPGTFILISSCSLAALSVERIVALTGHLKYRIEFTRVRIIGIITAIYVFNVGFVIGSIFVQVSLDCGWDIFSCHLYDATRWSRYVMIGISNIYDILLTMANIIIYRFVLRHKKRIKEQNMSVYKHNQSIGGEHEFAKIVCRIIFSYFLMHIPMSISILMLLWIDHMRDDIRVRMFRCFAYLCMQISTFIHMYIYIGKVKENKYNTYVLLSKFFKSYKVKAEQLRIDVYNIPIQRLNECQDA